MGSSGGSSGPSQTTSTTTQELPEWIEPHAKKFLGRAGNLSNQPFNPYPGERVAGLNPFHTGALQAGQSALQNNIPVGLDTMTYAAGGGFMNQNPYLDQTFNRAADQVQARTNNATRMQGLTNSGAGQMQSRQMNDLANNIYGGQYKSDMSHMMQAAQGLPGYAQSAGQLGLGFGDVGRDYEQSLLNESLRAFQEAEQHPYAQLDVLGNALGMSMGRSGTTSTTQPGYYEPNSLASMLGAGALGLGALKQFGGFG